MRAELIGKRRLNPYAQRYGIAKVGLRKSLVLIERRVKVRMVNLFVVALIVAGCSSIDVDSGAGHKTTDKDSGTSMDIERLSDRDDIYFCESDADCASVKAGCCGCRMGGSNTSINRRFVSLWEKEAAASCGGHMCPAFIRLPCPATGRCVSNRCTL